MTQVHLVLRLQLALEPKCPIEPQVYVCQDQAPRQVCIVTHHRGTRLNIAELHKVQAHSTVVPVLFEEALMPVRACEAAAAPAHLFGFF